MRLVAVFRIAAAVAKPKAGCPASATGLSHVRGVFVIGARRRTDPYTDR